MIMFQKHDCVNITCHCSIYLHLNDTRNLVDRVYTGIYFTIMNKDVHQTPEMCSTKWQQFYYNSEMIA